MDRMEGDRKRRNRKGGDRQAREKKVRGEENKG